MNPELKRIAREIQKTAFHLDFAAGHVANGRDRGHIAELHGLAKRMRSTLEYYFALKGEDENGDKTSTNDAR